MFSIFLRRIQRFLLPVKILLLALFGSSLVYLIINVSPEVGSITLASLLIFFILAIILNSLIIPLSISFLIFLKAVDLLSPLNLILFAVFLVLLGLYLRKK